MDERTFSEKALALAPKWHRLAFAILHNEADCEDAVQEALLRAWDNRARLREAAYFETWFTRILINESRRIYKKRAVRTVAAPVPPASNAPLRDALGAIDLRFRLPILLYHMEGYRIAEIAGILGMPAATVKWRLAKGRKLLKHLLEEADV